MAKGNFARKKEQKKPKKKNLFGKKNSQITTSRARYDNQLIGANPSPVKIGY